MGTRSDAVVSAAPVRTKRRDTSDIICSAELVNVPAPERMLSGGIVLAEVPRLCCRDGRMLQRAKSWCGPCLLRGACVARKPQAAAIRAEAHCRELIGAG